MLRRVVLVNADFGIRTILRWIEQAKFEASPQRMIQRLVNFLFRDQTLLNRPHQSSVISAATEIAPSFHRGGSGFLWRGNIMVLPRSPNVVDGAAIGNHIAVESPLLVQKVGEQEGIGARRHTINGIISAH